jgi:hypothetical protein
MPLQQGQRSHDRIKQTTIVALKRVIDPVMDLVFDAGITVREFNGLVRERAVRIAAARVSKESGRRSNSRIAILTGLARSEVARILNADDSSSSPPADQHPVRRVLSSWYDDQRFLEPDGDPAILAIYGRKRSFEQLVALFSGGIPVRAMLDQLVQIDAVEILSGRRVKVKSRVPIFRGMNSSAIAVVGERAGDLLGTLKSNLRASIGPLFEATAVTTNMSTDTVSLVRREIAEQGAAFIDGANSLLTRFRPTSRKLPRKGSRKLRIGVTVFYFQDELPVESHGATKTGTRRKNLQRRLKRSNPRSKLLHTSARRGSHD